MEQLSLDHGRAIVDQSPMTEIGPLTPVTRTSIARRAYETRECPCGFATFQRLRFNTVRTQPLADLPKDDVLVLSALRDLDDALLAHRPAFDRDALGYLPLDGRDRAPSSELVPREQWPRGLNQEPLVLVEELQGPLLFRYHGPEEILLKVLLR